MSQDLDTLPPDIRAMLRVERAFETAPEEGRTRLAGRLSAALPVFGATHAIGGASGAAQAGVTFKAGVVKAVLGLMLGGGTLVAIGVAHRSAPPSVEAPHRTETVAEVPSPSAPIDPPAPTSRATESPLLPEKTTAETVETSEPRTAARRPRPSFDAPSTTRPAPAVSPLERSLRLREEQVLLDDARDSIASGDPRTALAKTTTYAELFPRGELAAENTALRIRALAHLGEKDEARALLLTMRASYPESFLLEGAARDVDSIP